MRNGLFRRRLLPAVLAAVLMLALTGCGGKAEEIRFGTGGSAGTYYRYGSALAELAQPMVGMDLAVKSTAGSAANIRLLGEGFLQLALAQNDTLDDARRNVGAFAETGDPIGRSVGYGAVAALYMESCQVVVPAASDLESVADLRGKRVSVGEEESGVQQNAAHILLAHGLTFDMLEVKHLSFSAAAQAMAEGELDAFFLTAGAPTNAVETLAETMDIRMLSLSPDVTAALVESYGFYDAFTIPAGTYAWQDTDVETVGVRSVLVASDDLSPETVTALTAALFDHADTLQAAAPGSALLAPEFASQGVSIPFHPGAAAYYSGQGIAVEEGGTVE